MPTSSGAVSQPTTNYSFALATFEKLLKETRPGENLCYSPFGMEIILSIAHALAPEEERAAIESLLAFDESPQESLRDIQRKRRAYIQIPGVHILSSLWLRAPMRLPELTVTALRTEHGTDSYTRDFEADETVGEINDWASKNTNGRITDIVSDLSSLIRLAVNAIYFNCHWEDKFERESTKRRSFTLDDGSKVERLLMMEERALPYFEDAECQAVQLNYENRRFSMRVVLPREGVGLPSILRGSETGHWMTGLRYYPGHLELPRFCFRSDPPISLRKLGYSGKTTMDVLQKTYVRVDEAGTEAAAVTMGEVMGIEDSEPTPPPPFQMIVDRPFYFMICDNYTDTILFVGRVADPGEE